MIPRSIATLVPLALTALAIGCGSEEDGGSRFTVVATTTQVGDLVRNVAGPRAELRQLLHANADPHDYEPRPSDAVAVAEAAVVFRSGGDLDAWLGDLLESGGGDAPVVTLIDSVRARGDDPHWWQDPRNAKRAVAAIRDGLARADPSGKAVYARNAAAYIRRLRRLDAAVARCIDSVPAAQRRLVTTHDALGYFAARYDVEIIGSVLDSLSTQAQPSAGDTQALVEQMREEGVEVVFAESSVSQRLERAIADAAGLVGEPLWADTLGPKGSGGETYIDSITSNTEALVEGFSGGRESCRPRV